MTRKGVFDIFNSTFIRSSFLLIGLIFICAQDQLPEVYPHRNNESFNPGEVLEFKMTYGILGTIGKGSVKVHDDYYLRNNRTSYAVDVNARTTGFLNFFVDINDRFGAFIDTASLLPHQFYRLVQEGNYKKDEWTYFDHSKGSVVVRTWGKDGKEKAQKNFTMDSVQNPRDLISAFLYFRTVDFNRVAVGDTLKLDVFFEDQYYKMQVIYRGKSSVKVKAGSFNAIILKPVMPDNSLFKGPNSITVWLSDDKNKIPLKIEAEMFIGSAGVELTKYKGLRNPLPKNR